MPAPLITLPPAILQLGVYSHYILRAAPEQLAPENHILVTPALCETALPADFCACGAWMLFVPDDFPDPETPPCPPDSVPPSPA